MKTRFFLFTIVCLLCFLQAVAAFARQQGETPVVYMSSVEWPPYSGAELPGKGACVVIARKAFAAMGYELRVVFLPWKRAVMTTRVDPRFSGYFPEYHDERVGDEFYFSDRMGNGPLGFIELRDRPIRWETLQDLRKYRIGVVNGYVNEKEFDGMVRAGEFHVDPVVDDRINLRKLLAGRIDTAVMDPLVLRYLLGSGEDFRGQVGKVQLNDKLLDIKGFHLCFRKTEYGKHMCDLFNEGLKRIDWPAEQDQYMEWLFSSVMAP